MILCNTEGRPVGEVNIVGDKVHLRTNNSRLRELIRDAEVDRTIGFEEGGVHIRIEESLTPSDEDYLYWLEASLNGEFTECSEV